MRKTTSSSPSPRAPRPAGVNRYGRSGLDAQQFHSGPITAKASAISSSAMRARRMIHRAGHCPRCDHRLVAKRCPSCSFDSRDDLADPDEGLLGNREDDDATDEGE